MDSKKEKIPGRDRSRICVLVPVDWYQVQCTGTRLTRIDSAATRPVVALATVVLL